MIKAWVFLIFIWIYILSPLELKLDEGNRNKNSKTRNVSFDVGEILVHLFKIDVNMNMYWSWA
jgi:hypothetical protein